MICRNPLRRFAELPKDAESREQRTESKKYKAQGKQD
jgi:hypothetical protein